MNPFSYVFICFIWYRDRGDIYNSSMVIYLFIFFAWFSSGLSVSSLLIHRSSLIEWMWILCLYTCCKHFVPACSFVCDNLFLWYLSLCLSFRFACVQNSFSFSLWDLVFISCSERVFPHWNYKIFPLYFLPVFLFCFITQTSLNLPAWFLSMGVRYGLF